MLCAVAECGVFKGVCLCHLTQLRALLSCNHSKRIIGLDAVGVIPETNFDPGLPFRQHSIEDAGAQSISRPRLVARLGHKEYHGSVELLQGYICETVPDSCRTDP